MLSYKQLRDLKYIANKFKDAENIKFKQISSDILKNLSLQEIYNNYNYHKIDNNIFIDIELKFLKGGIKCYIPRGINFIDFCKKNNIK